MKHYFVVLPAVVHLREGGVHVPNNRIVVACNCNMGVTIAPDIATHPAMRFHMFAMWYVTWDENHLRYDRTVDSINALLTCPGDTDTLRHVIERIRKRSWWTQ